MEENEVKASPEQEPVTAEVEEKIAEQILEEANTPIEAQGQLEEPQSKNLSSNDIAELTAKAAADATEKALNSFQGKFANHSASQQKELQEMIEARLKPVIDWTEKVEQAQVEKLDPEKQVEYYKSKLQQKQEVPAEPQVKNEPTAEQKMLADTTRQLIRDNSLDLTEFDDRIWKGWDQNMTPGQLVALANKNILAIKNAKQPAKAAPQSQETPTDPAPPTTAGAPKTGTAGRITTISDLSQMMASGKIDSTQYREARKDIKNKGFTSL